MRAAVLAMEDATYPRPRTMQADSPPAASERVFPVGLPNRWFLMILPLLYLLEGAWDWHRGWLASSAWRLSLGVAWVAIFLRRYTWPSQVSYVMVGPAGLRIKSEEREPEYFAWSDITEAVVVGGGLAGRRQLEVRSGTRFAWIDFRRVKDPNGLIEAVARYSGSDSALLRPLALACAAGS